MESASQRPSRGTAQVLRPGDRDQFDLEGGVPLAATAD